LSELEAPEATSIANDAEIIDPADPAATLHMQQGADAYHAALVYYTRERDLAEWARLSSELGEISTRLAAHQAGFAAIATASEAVASLRNALDATEAKQDAESWAHRQALLGDANMILGAAQNSQTAYREAFLAFGAAAAATSSDKNPELWAERQIRRAQASTALGSFEGDEFTSDRVVEAYQAILKVVKKDKQPAAWLHAEIGLGNALFTSGAQKNSVVLLQDATDAERNALELIDPQREPQEFAMVESNISNALSIIAQVSNDPRRTDETIALLSGAVERVSRDRAPIVWAALQHNLCAALIQRARTRSDVAGVGDLRAALAAIELALKEETETRAPANWASAIGLKGQAELMLADRLKDAALAQSALRDLNDVQTFLAKSDIPQAQAYQRLVTKTLALLQRLKS
jgi:hypothetical protein